MSTSSEIVGVKCDKCHEMFRDKYLLNRHLNRKNACDKEKQVIFICQFCTKVFSTKGNLKFHEQNRCIKNTNVYLAKKDLKHDTDLVDALHIIQKRASESIDESNTTTTTSSSVESVSVLSTSVSTPTNSDDKEQVIHQNQHANYGTIENQTNIEQQNIIEHQTNIEQQTNINIQPQINNHFYILPYGYENMEHITHEYLLNLYDETRMWNAIPKLVKDIHLNKEHPENMNLQLKNSWKEIFQCKRDYDEWISFNSKTVTDDLIADKGEIIHKFFEQNKQNLTSNQTKNHTDLQSNLKSNKDYQLFLKKKIMEMFKNTRKMIGEISKMDRDDSEINEVEKECYEMLKVIHDMKQKKVQTLKKKLH
jgi:Zinc finger, C2H2 type